MVLELSADNFKKEVIESQIPVIVDFWASWCMPCRQLAPIFEKVSKDLAGKVKFAKISTEDYPELAAQYNITGIPCMIVFKGGEEADRIVGMNPEPLLKQKIQRIVGF